MNTRRSRRIVPGVDCLEGRQLLSVATGLRQGVLIIAGDRTADVVAVTEDHGRVEVHGRVNRGSPASFAIRDVRKIVFLGGAGNDIFVDNTPIAVTALGGVGNDVLIGGAGRDDLRGEAGDDSLFGRSGDDHLDGGIDDDRLFGNDGDDVLDDHNGRDRFDGGRGADDVEGGPDRNGGDPGDRNDDRGGGGEVGDDRTPVAVIGTPGAGADDTVHPEDAGRRRGRR